MVHGLCVLSVYPITTQTESCLKAELVSMCLRDSVFFDSLTAKVTHQSPCQSEAHTAALNMKKPAHVHAHTVHTETHKYTLMPVLGIISIT